MATGFDPEQPRAPKGDPDGGKWISFTHASPMEMQTRPPTAGEKQLNNLHFDKGQKKWVTANGKPVDPAIQARLIDAKAKPGWTGVAVNPDEDAPLQARGIDAGGRTQYAYSSENSEANAVEKFARGSEFNDDLPGIRANLAEAVGKGNESAMALSIIDQTAIRIGSDKETGAAAKAYGATTLLGQHVTLSGTDQIDLAFPGKSGTPNVATLNDKVLFDAISAKNLGPNDRVFATTDSKVNRFMKTIADPDYSPKDFRTWHGTATALNEVLKYDIPTSGAEADKIKHAVSIVVAKHLNNTPAVALKSYIDPAVWKTWGRGKP